jgi:hypothetical protein
VWVWGKFSGPCSSALHPPFPTGVRRSEVKVDESRENIDAQAASTDGRATLYANDQTHMFGRKVVIKKQRGGFKYKK